MSINVKCEGCGKTLDVPDGCEGRLIQCATCGKRMRVPNQAPPPAAPGSGDLPEAQAGFLKALAEEAAHEQRQSTAKAAKTDAEAELAPLSEAPAGEPGYAVTKPAAPPAVPAPGGMAEDKDALFKVLAEQAALEHSGAVQPGRAGAGPGQPPSAEALLRGHPPQPGNSASRRPPTSPATPSPGTPRRRLRRASSAAGRPAETGRRGGRSVAALRRHHRDQHRPQQQPEVAVRERPFRKWVRASPEAPPPEFPAALKAAQALAANAPGEVMAGASVGETPPQMPVLTSTGDVMLDATNLHIRDKNDADAGIQEMRSSSRSAVYESRGRQTS